MHPRWHGFQYRLHDHLWRCVITPHGCNFPDEACSGCESVPDLSEPDANGNVCTADCPASVHFEADTDCLANQDGGEAYRYAFYAEGPPGKTIDAYHLRRLTDSDTCAPECHAFGACAPPRTLVQYCDEPNLGKHVVHESGRCRCRPEDGRYRRRR